MDWEGMEAIFKEIWPDGIFLIDIWHIINGYGSVIADNHSLKHDFMVEIAACILVPYLAQGESSNAHLLESYRRSYNLTEINFASAHFRKWWTDKKQYWWVCGTAVDGGLLFSYREFSSCPAPFCYRATPEGGVIADNLEKVMAKYDNVVCEITGLPLVNKELVVKHKRAVDLARKNKLTGETLILLATCNNLAFCWGGMLHLCYTSFPTAHPLPAPEMHYMDNKGNVRSLRGTSQLESRHRTMAADMPGTNISTEYAHTLMVLGQFR